MICKKCGAEFDGAFCPKCGERAEEKLTVCPVCGRERAEGENFCAKCGYAYIKIVDESRKKLLKKLFDQTNLIAGVNNYILALNICRILFSVFLFLILASPIMLHEGINASGSGYTNAFDLYVDGRFTGVCAVLLIIAFYSLIYGIYCCVKNFIFFNHYEGWISYIFYFCSCLVVFIVCCIGCSVAGEWYGDAGAGLSFGIFVGLVGIVLTVLRYKYEDMILASASNEQRIKVSDDIKKTDDKTRKCVGKGIIIITGILVVAIIITSIVQTFYTNPFNTASYAYAQTRADVIKQFGMPENADADSSFYVYYSTEYAAAERMIDVLIAAQEKELTDNLGAARSFDEDDFESMFDCIAGIDAIIQKLGEKQEKEFYKKSVVTFNNDGGDDRNKDTVNAYYCENITPDVEGEVITERMLDNLKIISGYYFGNDKSAQIEYLAKYNDGSFSGGTVKLSLYNYNEYSRCFIFNDVFGEYKVSLNELVMMSE